MRMAYSGRARKDGACTGGAGRGVDATSGDKRSGEIRFSSAVAWGEGEGRVT